MAPLPSETFEAAREYRATSYNKDRTINVIPVGRKGRGRPHKISQDKVVDRPSRGSGTSLTPVPAASVPTGQHSQTGGSVAKSI